MSETESDDEFTEEELEAISAQIVTAVQFVAARLEDLDVATATDQLLERLNAIEGVDFERDWAVQVVEGLRRGDEITIEIG